MRENKPFLLGPFFVPTDAAASDFTDIKCLPWSFSFSTSEDQSAVGIYVLEDRWRAQPTFEQYMFRADCCPFGVEYRRFQSKETSVGEFIGVSPLLAAMYEQFSPSSSLFATLNEFATHFPFTALTYYDTPQLDLMEPSLAAQGFAVKSITSYGDVVRVEICWLPETALREECWQSHFLSGGIKFRPRHDGTLGNGKWFDCWETTHTFQLFKLLKKLKSGPPVNFLSSGGITKCLSEFKWEDRHKTKKTDLQMQRMEIVRINESLWGDPRSIARLLKEAGLYSNLTNESQIVKTIQKMIETISH